MLLFRLVYNIQILKLYNILKNNRNNKLSENLKQYSPI